MYEGGTRTGLGTTLGTEPPGQKAYWRGLAYWIGAATYLFYTSTGCHLRAKIVGIFKSGDE